MATGKQMLEAVRGAIEKRPESKDLRITLFDALDLFKLTPEELAEFHVDRAAAEAICDDLAQEKLGKLGEFVGVKISVAKGVKNLIPGEGFRRTAGIWATGDEDPTVEELVREIRELRSPGLR